MFAILAILFTSTTFTYAVDWNGNNWALWCDFIGNDLASAQIRGEDCGGRCESTPGCTHFTWTNYNGGTCWMKKNGASKSDAIPKYDSNAVCGVVAGSNPNPGTGGGTVPGAVRRNGKSTRYWDCCKPSCSWSGKASVFNPVNTCSRDGKQIIRDVNAQSGCGGGNAFTCNSNIPWSINNDLSYAFAAAHITGQSESDWCCACYEWTFTSGPRVGKKLIVQVTNSGGDLGENHFDLQIPGGGVGIFNGCSAQWGAPNDGWGARYGGVNTEAECYKLPEDIRSGCFWRFQWFKNADNPTFTFIPVTCPKELTDKSGCVRR